MSKIPDSTTDPLVLEFTCTWGLATPIILPYTNHSYQPDWCHVSSKSHAIQNGGKRVHGWALWEYQGAGVMGNFHSVWEHPNGQLVDVTPPKFDTDAIMFVADPSLDIVSHEGVFEHPVNRMAIGPNPLFIDVYTGEPTQFSHFGVSPNDPSFVAYCRTVGLSITDYPTDSVYG